MEEEKKVTKKSSAGKTTTKKRTSSSNTASKSATKKTTSTKKTEPKKSSSSAAKKASTSKKKEEVKTTTKKATTPKKTSTTPKKKSTTASTKASNTKRKTTTKIDTIPIESKENIQLKESKEIKEEKYVISEDLPTDVEIVSNEEIKQEEPVKEAPTIQFSNIIIAAIIVVWIFILLLLGNRLYHKYQEKLYDEGYFYHENKDIKKVSVSELQNLIDTSTSHNMFLFFNYRRNKETYELERDLSTIIDDYHLQEKFYYVDLTDMVGQLNCELSCVANEGLGIESINNIPAIVYVQNKAIVDIAQREDKKILEAADFVKLLDMYEYKK